MTPQGTILVTGATGKVGRNIVTRLAGSGTAVRALTRDPATAGLPAGVDVVRGDATVPADVAAALDGVTTVFLLWPGTSADGAQAVVDVLAERVRRVVYLSASAVEDGKDAEDNGVWGQVEQAIERSGLEWTHLRAGGFAANTLGWAEQIRTEGRVHEPYGGAGRSLIHERDIADVAVLALTGDGHTGAKYVLTGPEVVTQADQVRIIGEVIGRPVRWEERDPEEARAGLAATMGDAAYADAALAYWATLVDRPEQVATTVRELTGVPARTFREWAADHADAFRPVRPLSTRELAERFVAAFRTGAIASAEPLMSVDMVRIAPLETSGKHVELHGLASIMENAAALTGDYEIHGVDFTGPFVAEDRFAVRFTFDQTHIPTGTRLSTTKMSLYTASGGKVVREEVFYFDSPQEKAVRSATTAAAPAAVR